MFRFEKLDGWKAAVKYADSVYLISRTFPDSEKFGLTAQMRRAAISISANIAEGSSRTTDKDFARFIEISYGSMMECVSEASLAPNQNFITDEKFQSLYQQAESLARMLSGLRATLQTNSALWLLTLDTQHSTMEPTNTIVISADRHERLRQFFRDLWDYKELFLTFLERDLKVRYKQTAMGAIWVVLQPLVTTAAYVLIFGKIAKMPTDGMPYTLFFFAANVPWSSFSRELIGATLSVENNSHLISKVYFPRIVVPMASVCAVWVDFTIGWVFLNALALWMGVWSWTLVAISPLLVLLQSCTSLGVGLILATLNATYRDVKNAISFIVQILMLATPVFYPISRLPDWARPYAFINPMATVITAYRSSLSHVPFDWPMIGLSMLAASVYLVVGFWFFRKHEALLADVL